MGELAPLTGKDLVSINENVALSEKETGADETAALPDNKAEAYVDQIDMDEHVSFAEEDLVSIKEVGPLSEKETEGDEAVGYLGNQVEPLSESDSGAQETAVVSDAKAHIDQIGDEKHVALTQKEVLESAEEILDIENDARVDTRESAEISRDPNVKDESDAYVEEVVFEELVYLTEEEKSTSTAEVADDLQDHPALEYSSDESREYVEEVVFEQQISLDVASMSSSHNESSDNNEVFNF